MKTGYRCTCSNLLSCHPTNIKYVPQSHYSRTVLIKIMYNNYLPIARQLHVTCGRDIMMTSLVLT